MYITPRPHLADDPLFAVRMGMAGALAYLAVALLNPALPPVIAALPVGLIIALRMKFVPAKGLAGPIVFALVVWLLAFLCEWLRPMPLVYVLTMGLFYYAGFRMILSTGSPAGMLIVVATVLMSIMGMSSIAALHTMRDAFTEAAVVTLVIMSLVFLLFPVRTRETLVETPVPSEGRLGTGATIRAAVLLMLSFWLYSVMQPADMMMAVVAAMVLVFPTRRSVQSEALVRSRATLYGGAIALIVLGLFTLSAHLPVLLVLIFLAGLYLGDRMVHGPQPSMVYQYAFTVALALIAGALSTQDPGYATFTRIVLTLAGTLAATLLVGLLDRLTGWNDGTASDAPDQADRIDRTEDPDIVLAPSAPITSSSSR